MTALCFAVSVGAAVPGVTSRLEQQRIDQAIKDIVRIEASVERYRLAHHALPDSLAQLDQATSVDPWGNTYEYVNFATRGLAGQRRYHNLPVNFDYDLYSRGSDGRTEQMLNAEAARDDIVRARDGEFVGLAAEF